MFFDERKARGTARYKAVRLRVLRREDHLCRVCRQIGIIRAATELDHIRPAAGNARLFWDEANMQPLCAACHETKHTSDRPPGYEAWVRRVKALEQT